MAKTDRTIRHRSWWSVSLRGLVLLGSLLVSLAAPLLGQGSGALQGLLSDGRGGRLPGVVVTVGNDDTGLRRSSTTGADGTYYFAALPAGSYWVLAELAGHTTVTAIGVEVHVATSRSQDLILELAEIDEAITVTTAGPLIATSPALGATISQSLLASVPLSGRQLANLATLAPGTSLGVDPDPTKGHQLVVALNGGIGRNVNYLVDGADNRDDTVGGALLTFNLEAVQEFTFLTSQYQAEYGRSTGGVLSVVTKTGTNSFGGSAYGSFRDRDLNSRTETERRTGRSKGEYDRQQYGFSLGGPIVQDRAHFFAAAERSDHNTSFGVNTGGILPELGNQALPLSFEDTLLSAKATWSPTGSQLWQARIGSQQTEGGLYSAGLLSTPGNLGTSNSDALSVLVGHTAFLSGRHINELMFQFSDFENITSRDTELPTQIFANGLVYGPNTDTPQSTLQEKWQIKDNFSFTQDLLGSSHHWKVGFDYTHLPTLGGRLSAGTGGEYFYLGNDPAGPIRQVQVFAGSTQFSSPIDQYSVYLQDDFQATPNLTLNLGVRYDSWDGFDLDQRSNPIWQTLSTQTTYTEDYLQDFQDGKGGQLDHDNSNVGPRLGFSWDTRGDGRGIVRGGWGVYYGFPATSGTILFPTAALRSSFGLAYLHTNPNGIRNADGSFYTFGHPLPPNQLQGSTTLVPNEVASPTLAVPKSTQASLGYSWQATDWVGFNFDLVKIAYRDLPFRFRANPIDPTTGARRFPQFGDFRIWSGEGEADYEGLNLGVRLRATRMLEVQGFYTLSEASGNVLAGADDLRLTAAGHQPDLGAVGDHSVEPLDPGCDRCFGPLNTDARHRATLSVVYRGPRDLTISTIGRYRSGVPYTEWTGLDSNGDGYTFELPAGQSVNNLRGASFSQIDLRVSRAFELGKGSGEGLSLEVIVEVFNLFDRDNPARFVGNRLADNFGRPTVFAGDPLQGEQRLAQIGLRFQF